MFKRKSGIEIKSADQLAVMRQAGLVVAHALEAMRVAVAPGVSTDDLDDIAAAVLDEHGATSNFLGYHGYPRVLCASVNEEVVHGIPGGRVLREGDLISLDFGAVVDGWHGDAAISVEVGAVRPEVHALSEATRESLWAGLRAARVGARLTDISHAIETSLRTSGRYGIVQEYGGHGIGTRMHMDPHILNYGSPGRGPVLKEGMVLAIEPMAVLGSPVVQVLDDDWTVVTADKSVASHWEHTVAITEAGPWVLTTLEHTQL